MGVRNSCETFETNLDFVVVEFKQPFIRFGQFSVRSATQFQVCGIALISV